MPVTTNSYDTGGVHGQTARSCDSCAVPAAADWRFVTGLTLNRFEQQIKTEVGGVRGERLVEAFEFGFSGIATHRILGPLSGGLSARYDIGTRKAGRFGGVENGRTVTTGETGGAYSELWFGPLVRAQ